MIINLALVSFILITKLSNNVFFFYTTTPSEKPRQTKRLGLEILAILNRVHIEELIAVRLVFN